MEETRGNLKADRREPANTTCTRTCHSLKADPSNTMFSCAEVRRVDESIPTGTRPRFGRAQGSPPAEERAPALCRSTTRTRSGSPRETELGCPRSQMGLHYKCSLSLDRTLWPPLRSALRSSGTPQMWGFPKIISKTRRRR